jgi:formylglycine-generating enzyme required for sulfatase activity/tRNA A-37 threonylcarbamoyl transferase component Bud32
VYAVQDLSLKRNLAVKVLSSDLIQSHTVLARFRREAETVAQLSHPNIVPLHFVGEHEGLVYLVMAAIDGGTLADRLDKDGALPIDDATRILAEVASALAHAHKRGVIHRDIKPENVLIDAESGRALVSDFGIARTAESGALTGTGMVVGTPAYLSPEQVTGETSDHRADIYAFGVMAYEVLAGQLPFTGATPAAILMNRVTGPPPSLHKMRSDVPEEIIEMIDSCIAVDAVDRPGSADEVLAVLKGNGARISASTRTHKARRNVRLPMVVAAGIFLVAIVVAAAVSWSRRQQTPDPAAVKPLTSGGAVKAVDSAMVLIPAGSYTIGSNDGPAASRPAHTVALSAFGLDAREITVGEYDGFVQSKRVPSPWTARPVSDNAPVTGVTWLEASSYCTWKHGDTGRLPTEEEWEAAARGSDARVYPWGNAWDPSAANTGSRANGPVAVGSFPRGQSPFGADDLIGNVWEWTSSPFKQYADAGGGGSSDFYVIRGGAYNSYDEISTAIFRGRAKPAAARSDLAATGFRCAMTARE